MMANASIFADLIFLAIGVIIVLHCTAQGFLKILTRSCRFWIAILLSYLLGGNIVPILGNGPIESVVAYLLIFVVSWIGMSFLMGSLDACFKKVKILNHINKLLGGVVGIVIALTVLLLISTVLKLFFVDSAFYESSVLIRRFGNSEVHKVLKIFNGLNLHKQSI